MYRSQRLKCTRLVDNVGSRYNDGLGNRQPALVGPPRMVAHSRDPRNPRVKSFEIEMQHLLVCYLRGFSGKSFPDVALTFNYHQGYNQPHWV